MTIVPLGSRLLVKLLPRHETFLPLTVVDKQKHYQGVRWGEVKYVGPMVREVKAGDKILVEGDRGTSFDFGSDGSMNDGVEWRALRQADILAVEETHK